jgi:hypothetical protein
MSMCQDLRPGVSQHLVFGDPQNRLINYRALPIHHYLTTVIVFCETYKIQVFLENGQ